LVAYMANNLHRWNGDPAAARPFAS